MTSVILAAGIGSRLRPLTRSSPKCLIPVAGKPILEYQLDALSYEGIKEILIVVGYLADQVRFFTDDWLQRNKELKTSIKFIENPCYETTNNMFSLYLAKSYIHDRSFILLNGDIVLSKEIIHRLLTNRECDLVCVDTSIFFDESMKITVDESGYINDISKTLDRQKSYGVSIDVYKFSEKSSAILFDMITQIIEYEQNLKEWTEVAMQRLFQERKLKMKPLDIKGSNWFEIDTIEDLKIAEAIFSST